MSFLAIEWSELGTGAMVMLFLLACVLLILTVLIQKPQGGGLAGAFGSGAGSGQTAFGTRTGDALTVATIIMFVFYLATAIGLTFLIKPSSGTSASSMTAPAGAPAEGGAKPAAPVAGTPVAPVGGTPGTAAPTGAAPVTTPATTPPATTPGAAPTTAPGTTPPTTPPATAPATTPAAPAPAPATPDAPKP